MKTLCDKIFRERGFDSNPWDNKVQFRRNIVDRDADYDEKSGFTAVYHFTVADHFIPKNISAVAEHPEYCHLRVNGKEVSWIMGETYLDYHFGVADISRCIKAGENKVEVIVDVFHVVMELDAIYIKGEFSVIEKDGKPVATIKDNDSIIFFNFRPDRAREITRVFCDDEFTGFDRGERVKTTYVCFTEYDVTIENKDVAFRKTEITNTFGEFLAAHGMKQARIAETEKYAHVTFFFNGGVEEPNAGEDRILVKSPKVATYDLQPEMSAYEVCDKLVDAIKSDQYDVIIINFANPDMVGHTGVEEAAVKAVEAVDACVGKAVAALKEVDGQMFICADHGNAEQLLDYETGAPFTAHTTNPVPFILVNADPAYGLKEGGCLADIAPTLIELMGMDQPKEMTGKSLLVRK